MATWIAIEDELPTGSKSWKLRGLLGLKYKRDVIGIVGSLRLFTLRNAWRDGNLEAWGVEGVAEACEWDGDSEALVSALRESGFLDGWIVVNWVNDAGRIIRDRIRREGRRESGASSMTVIAPGVRDIWNSFAEDHGLQRVKMAVRAKSPISEADLRKLLSVVESQPFLLGNSSGGWKIDLPWIMDPENAEKIMSKKYERKNGTSRSSSNAPDPEEARERGRDIIAKARARRESRKP